MDLLLRLDPEAAEPLYLQAARQLREAIQTGQLAPGTRLPSSRELARAHRIARNTVTLAYQHLLSEGYLEGRERSGHYVNHHLPDHALRAVTGPALPAASSTALPLSAWGRAVLEVEPHLQGPRLPYDFRQRFPVADSFPADAWRRYLTTALADGGTDLLEYGEPAGYGPLRAAVAAYAERTRGLSCRSDQVIMTSGTRQAVDLLARVLLNPGDAVVVEEPGYPGTRQALQALGARVIPVPVDEQGLVVERLPPERVALVCVTPSHQYPTGVTLSLARRLQLIDWARRTGALILEDDYDGEFRHTGRPLQALQGLDGGSSVIYAGTFAKSLAPGLRLGYLVAPPALCRVLVQAKWIADRQTATLPQAAMALFIADGGLERHLRRLRLRVRERLERFRQAVETYLPDARLSGTGAGMHLLLTLPEVRTQADEQRLITAAAGAQVGLQPASPCSTGSPGVAGLLCWYAHLPAGAIEEGVRRLASVRGGAS